MPDLFSLLCYSFHSSLFALGTFYFFPANLFAVAIFVSLLHSVGWSHDFVSLFSVSFSPLILSFLHNKQVLSVSFPPSRFLCPFLCINRRIDQGNQWDKTTRIMGQVYQKEGRYTNSFTKTWMMTLCGWRRREMNAWRGDLIRREGSAMIPEGGMKRDLKGSSFSATPYLAKKRETKLCTKDCMKMSEKRGLYTQCFKTLWIQDLRRKCPQMESNRIYFCFRCYFCPETWSVEDNISFPHTLAVSFQEWLWLFLRQEHYCRGNEERERERR